MQGHVAQVLEMTPRREDEPTPALLRQMLIESDQKHDDGHQRLRGDIRELERSSGRLENRIVEAEKSLLAAHSALRAMREGPIDGMKIRFPLTIIASIVVTAAITAWVLAGKIDSGNKELSDQLTKTQTDQATYMKRTEERLTDQQQSIQQLRNRFELLQNNVTDFMLREGAKRR